MSLHLLSPLSSNLFNNAIMQSGTALADWAVLEGTEAIKRNSEILASLGCNQTRVEDVLECAKKVDAHTAIEKSDEHFFTKANHGVAQFTFLPVIDNYFLEDEPINLLNRGKFKKCPVLLGANKDEGNWFFVYASITQKYSKFYLHINFLYRLLLDMPFLNTGICPVGLSSTMKRLRFDSVFLFEYIL